MPGYSFEADSLQREKCSLAEGPKIELAGVGGWGVHVYLFMHMCMHWAVGISFTLGKL